MLNAFFEPASVAVIGASTNPSKLGYAVLENLVEGGYAQRGGTNHGAGLSTGRRLYEKKPRQYEPVLKRVKEERSAA